jgi:pimeloyl-ACP methyl ester carboxylesterase
LKDGILFLNVSSIDVPVDVLASLGKVLDRWRFNGNGHSTYRRAISTVRNKNENGMRRSTGIEFLTVAGARLEIKRFPGETGKPALVFLHEGLGCIDMWGDFPARLSYISGCPALVYSRRGYGRSAPCDVPRPLTYMHDEGLIVLPDLLRTAEIGKHILIGHSDGGSIALINAGGAPAPGLIAVITMAAHVFCETLSVTSIAQAKTLYQKADLRTRLAKYHRDNVDCAFWGWNEAWLDPDFMQWNIERYLPKITVPQLVIQGYDDPYGTAAQVKAIEKQSAGPVQVRMLENCGHSPFKEQAQKSLEVTSEFISRL